MIRKTLLTVALASALLAPAASVHAQAYPNRAIRFIVPYAPGGGNETLMLGVTRAEWGVIHSWLSVIAVFITAVEIILTRKFLTEGLKHMAQARSGQAGDA